MHHRPFSPKNNGCYIYDADEPLENHLGEKGIASLLSQIDVGQHIYAEYQGPSVSNMRKWVDFFRRLHTPYYEEARIYWDKALNDGFFEGQTESAPYLPESLKLLIKEYGANV